MLRIMLVEDEELERQAIRTIIENAGLDVEIVAETDNGPEALDLIVETKPDVAFVDIRIPGINGLDFIEQVGSEDIQTEFVIVSAFDYFGYAKKAMSLGVREYLLKPVRKEDIVKILEDMIEVYEERREHVKATNCSAAISLALEYMNANYGKDLSLSEVAGAIPLNPYYFSRQFKNEMGVTFTDFLMRIRIDRAKELLIDTNMTITEIASAVGYQDSNYFSTVFRKQEGVSPREFRRSGN